MEAICSFQLQLQRLDFECTKIQQAMFEQQNLVAVTALLATGCL